MLKKSYRQEIIESPFENEQDEAIFKAPLRNYVSTYYPLKKGLSIEDLLESPNKICQVQRDEVSLIVWHGDITKLKVDSIVNAANSELLGGGGVDGAIHRSAGKNLLRECAGLGTCEVGKAKITKGYDLPSKTVIHTVGPIINGDDELETKSVDLANCYKSCLLLAEDYGLKSIAFSCISCGGYPQKDAALTAVKTTLDYLEQRRILTQNRRFRSKSPSARSSKSPSASKSSPSARKNDRFYYSPMAGAAASSDSASSAPVPSPAPAHGRLRTSLRYIIFCVFQQEGVEEYRKIFTALSSGAGSILPRAPVFALTPLHLATYDVTTDIYGNKEGERYKFAKVRKSVFDLTPLHLATYDVSADIYGNKEGERYKFAK